MKKVLIPILLCFASSVFAQMVPEDFKIPKAFDLSKAKFNYQTDNKNSIKRNIVVIPPNESGIISNFISDIIVIGNGDIFLGRDAKSMYEKTKCDSDLYRPNIILGR